MPLVKGQSYEWSSILQETESVAGPVFYLLHFQGTRTIAAASLDIAFNPRAPYEIWAGSGEHVSDWADTLDAQLEPFEVFVREMDGRHYYRGKFKRVTSSNDAGEIALRLAQVPQRGPIYKIIFLTEVEA
jgi:hypothetical protein